MARTLQVVLAIFIFSLAASATFTVRDLCIVISLLVGIAGVLIWASAGVAGVLRCS